MSESLPADFGMPSLAKMTRSLSGSVLLGMVAGVALQLWIVTFLGWLGENALYVRSIYTPVGFLNVGVTQGLTVTLQVTAGIALRSGRLKSSLDTVTTFLIVGCGLLCATGLIFAAASGPICAALGVPAASRPAVTEFVWTVSLAEAAGLIPLLAASALRGIGRAGVAAVLSIAYTVVFAAVMLALHLTTALGVQIVPVAGFIAAGAVGVVSVAALPRYGLPLTLRRPHREAFGQLWTMALPVALTFVLLSAVTIGYLRALRHAGAAQVAGFILGQNTTFYLMTGALAIGAGAAIAVNIRPGQDRLALNRAGLGVALRMVFPVYAVVAIATFFLRGPLAHALTGSAAVADVTSRYFAWTGLTLVLYSGTITMLLFLEQIGRARVSFVLNLVYFSIMLAIALSLPQPVSSQTLAEILAIGNVVGFVTLIICIRYVVLRRPAPEVGEMDTEEMPQPVSTDAERI